MHLSTVKIQKPDDINFILGQSHFIKTVEDLHEALVGAVPGLKFGLAFCESSGPVLLRDAFPINVLNAVKSVPEVCGIFCATANPVEVVLAETEQGRGILGVIDGLKPKGIEGDAEIAARKELLRKFGYKL